MLPALTSALHIPARGHELTLSRVTAVALLIVFGLPLPAALSRQSASAPQDQDDSAGPEQQDADGTAREWPLWLSIGLLDVAGVGAAFASEGFVTALTPAIGALHLSQTFAGLVVVAIAGNAVENVVGIRLHCSSSCW